MKRPHLAVVVLVVVVGASAYVACQRTRKGGDRPAPVASPTAAPSATTPAAASSDSLEAISTIRVAF